MFNWKASTPNAKSRISTLAEVFSFEILEGRRLLSGGPFGFHGGGFGHGHGDHGDDFGGATIEFSQAPTAVQTGLDTLAATDNLTAPTTTQKVYLGNSNGTETYTIDITGTGTDTKLTVDQTGTPVTSPTLSSTTFGAVTNTAVTDEINAIATALSLTAPTSTTAVSVSTAADGTATYTVRLDNGSTGSWGWRGGAIVSVDSNGNPVGNQRLPLSTLSTAIQTGLTSNAPAGATALTSTSLINVRTENGSTFYSATYTSTGVRTTITVNSAGVLTSLPSTTQVQFSTLPTAAQTELQTLATADGVSGTIAATQVVLAFDEGNGTTVYSVRLGATSTDSNGDTYTHLITLAVDQAGNPTVPPNDGFGRGGFGGFGGFGVGMGLGGCGLDNSDDGTSSSTDSGSDSSGTTTTTVSTKTAKKATTKIVAKTASKSLHHRR